MKNKNRPLIQIIGPVYNEEETIKKFCDRLIKTLKKHDTNYKWEVLFVLDKSSDNSYKILKEICKKNNKVKLLYLSARFGHQMSLLAGIDNSSGDVIIMMDTDLQHPPELISKFLIEYEKGNDIVAGVRFISGENNFLKKIGSKYFYSIMRFLTNIDIKDGEADFRLISKRVANVFKNDIREQNQFLRGLFSWVGFDKSYVLFEADKRYQGKSKYNWITMFSFASVGITSFSKKPLRFAVFLGLGFSVIGLLFSAYNFINYWFNNNVPPGWTTLTIIICILGGIQLLFLGVIGEYLGQIFDQVKNRPLYLVKEKINFKK